jgi:hypothetical protein
MADDDPGPGDVPSGPWWTPEPGMLKVNMTPRGDGAPPQLRGAWAKWERAVEHLTALERDGQRWLDTAFDIAIAFDPVRDAHVAAFVVREPSPPRLGVIAGDCFHNLRSSLDLLAWELAHRRWDGTAKRILRRIYFPISAADADPNRFTKQELVDDFGGDVVARMERFQWFESDRRDAEPLRLLHEVSRIDKHRLALTAVISCRLAEVRYGWEPPSLTSEIEPLWTAGEHFHDGTEICLIRFVEGLCPAAVVRVTQLPPAELRLTFGTGSQFGPLTIAGCVWRVREILESFEDFFVE